MRWYFLEVQWIRVFPTGGDGGDPPPKFFRPPPNFLKKPVPHQIPPLLTQRNLEGDPPLLIFLSPPCLIFTVIPILLKIYLSEKSIWWLYLETRLTPERSVTHLDNWAVKSPTLPGVPCSFLPEGAFVAAYSSACNALGCAKEHGLEELRCPLAVTNNQDILLFLCSTFLPTYYHITYQVEEAECSKWNHYIYFLSN